MKIVVFIISIIAVVLLTYFLWVEGNEHKQSPQKMSSAPTSAQVNGKALYELNCASCHGLNAKGTNSGPPFLHKVYEPSHHSDAAFLMAAKRGVRAHHWKFGDMPAIPNVSEAEIIAITTYIRQMQRMVGIK